MKTTDKSSWSLRGRKWDAQNTITWDALVTSCGKRSHISKAGRTAGSPTATVPIALTMTTFPDYYSLLNVSQTASIDEIRAAYKKESLKSVP